MKESKLRLEVISKASTLKEDMEFEIPSGKIEIKSGVITKITKILTRKDLKHIKCHLEEEWTK